ncbi:MAG: DJ-1/PfpI family protein [Sneathiella sp.]|nr:DJ-1/PfpI family protein [Sneathiella sp.]
MINQNNKIRIGMVLFPNLTQLDLTGPYAVLGNAPNVQLDLLWHRLEPVHDATGFVLTPTKTFESCGALDVLFVPGGPGQLEAMEDQLLVNFVRQAAVNARYITSVCTGSFLLGAAVLLKGKLATSHWMVVDQLKHLGATPIHDRVVEDGNVITGAGVTSGIDFGLILAAKLFGEETAKCMQLGMEYDPAPPFNSGSISTASNETIATMVERGKDLTATRLEAVKRVGQSLR